MTGVYVHFPYCAQRCPYCDFTVTTKPVEHVAYRDAVLAELNARAGEFAGPAVSVYFGGGTPGLWRPDCIGAVIDGVAARLGVRAGAEITVECNPEDVNAAHLAGLRTAGVNRISLGTQSFDDALLSALGRGQDAAMNRRAARAVRAAGIPELSLDLMHGAVGQSAAGAVADVEAALALEPTHVSIYQLTIEPRTVFGARARRGERLLGDDDLLAAQYEAICAALRSGGLEPYEISNAAVPGHEAVHNRLYWTQGDYLGLGVGAHGFRKMADGTAVRWQNVRQVDRYLERPGAQEDEEWLDAAQLLEERVLTGLRLYAGLPIDDALAVRYGLAARRLEREGLLACVDDVWRATARGRLILDRVVLELVSG